MKFLETLELRLHGRLVGRLRVGDYVPRSLAPSQKEMLQELAHLAEQQIEERASQRELVEENEQLRTWAFVDSLTMSWNRSAIREIAFRELDAARPRNRPVGLAMIDLDWFKRVNDSHGHDAGDAVLREISARLRAAIRATDAVGRYGGEEFLVVMPECSLIASLAAGERIRQAVAKPLHIEGLSLTVTASIGVAVHRGDDRTLDDTIREADRALYRAKARGRNCVAASPSAHPGGKS